jgi:hypothetical protein
VRIENFAIVGSHEIDRVVGALHAVYFGDVVVRIVRSRKLVGFRVCCILVCAAVKFDPVADLELSSLLEHQKVGPKQPEIHT